MFIPIQRPALTHADRRKGSRIDRRHARLAADIRWRRVLGASRASRSAFGREMQIVARMGNIEGDEKVFRITRRQVVMRVDAPFRETFMFPTEIHVVIDGLFPTTVLLVMIAPCIPEIVMPCQAFAMTTLLVT